MKELNAKDLDQVSGGVREQQEPTTADGNWYDCPHCNKAEWIANNEDKIPYCAACKLDMIRRGSKTYAKPIR